MKIRNPFAVSFSTAALLWSVALLGPVPAGAQASRTAVAAAEPAVPNTPRQPTPASLAAPQLGSPDASQIDATDGKDDADKAPLLADDNTDGIVATVNDESISEYELRQRMGLIIATSGNPQQPSAEEMKRIRATSLEQLEDEAIERQEAVKNHITVSPAETDKAVNQMLTQNRMQIEDLRRILGAAGSNEAALRAQIAASIAWNKAVQAEYEGRAIVTDAQIEAEMQRYAEGANKPHYLVGEIFLPVYNPDQDAKVQKDAEALETQLQQGASFSLLAHQFSQHPTAAAGGEMGIVREGQLAPELDNALRAMKPGTISEPIRSVGGYYILALHERQEPLGTQVNTPVTAPTGTPGNLKLARLLLPMGNAPTKEMMETVMKVAAQIRAGYSGCEKLAQLPAQIHGAIFMNLGDTKLSDLSPEIQKALADSKPGEMAVPLFSDAGIELIGRCDPKVEVRTAYTMPTREQVTESLYQDQISAMARRYKRDLKRDADVEVR